MNTSQLAAESIENCAQTLRNRVVALVAESGESGMTCDEVEVATGMRHQTASARVRELELQGRLIKTDRVRRTSSGRMARIYVLAGYRFGP